MNPVIAVWVTEASLLIALRVTCLQVWVCSGLRPWGLSQGLGASREFLGVGPQTWTLKPEHQKVVPQP